LRERRSDCRIEGVAPAPQQLGPNLRRQRLRRNNDASHLETLLDATYTPTNVNKTWRQQPDGLR
jgi:hypothetical protein